MGLCACASHYRGCVACGLCVAPGFKSRCISHVYMYRIQMCHRGVGHLYKTYLSGVCVVRYCVCQVCARLVDVDVSGCVFECVCMHSVGVCVHAFSMYVCTQLWRAMGKGCVFETL